MTRIYKNLFTTLVLFIFIAIVLVLPSQAELIEDDSLEPIIPDEYVTIDSIFVGITIIGGTAICSGEVSMKANNSGTQTLLLQKKNGTSWTTIGNWSSYCPAGNTVSITKEKTVSSGMYRAVAISKSGGETVRNESNTVSIP